MTNEEKIDRVLELVRRELVAATNKFGSFNSAHEGKAIIEEELDELWEHVRANTGYEIKALKEAIQIAAMGARYVVDFGDYYLKFIPESWDSWEEDEN